MSGSFTVGRIGGTAIRLHITFILFLLWIGVSTYSSGGYVSARSTVALMILVFTCVLAHEFGHILTARYFGIKTPDVTLWPIGGVASMERVPEDPWQELPVALAGPLVNVVIAATLMVFGNLSFNTLINIDMATASLWQQLALVNVALVVFNLVPAFPMDGGRVFRAFLAMKLGVENATRIATRVGQGFAFLFLALGLFFNPMLILIGLFIFVAASAEMQAGQMHRALDGLLVSDCLEQQVQSLSPDMSLTDAMERMLHSSQPSFPVIDARGAVVGIIDRTALPGILKGTNTLALVSAVMRLPRMVSPTAKLEDAMKDMSNTHDVAEIVADGQGRMIGMLTLRSIAEFLFIRRLQSKSVAQKRGA